MDIWRETLTPDQGIESKPFRDKLRAIMGKDLSRSIDFRDTPFLRSSGPSRQLSPSFFSPNVLFVEKSVTLSQKKTSQAEIKMGSRRFRPAIFFEWIPANKESWHRHQKIEFFSRLMWLFYFGERKGRWNFMFLLKIILFTPGFD